MGDGFSSAVSQSHLVEACVCRLLQAVGAYTRGLQKVHGKCVLGKHYAWISKNFLHPVKLVLTCYNMSEQDLV